MRGLLNYRTTADCMPHLLDKKNVEMLTTHKVFTVEELQSRRDIMLENYCKSVTIEAHTMVDMARSQIAPAIERFTADVARNAAAKKAICPDAACAYESDLVTRLSALTDAIAFEVAALESAVAKLAEAADVVEESAMIRDSVLAAMAELRASCDEAETLTDRSYWPFPTYADILFSVR